MNLGRLPTLTAEQHLALIRELSNDPPKRAQLFLELAETLAEVVGDPAEDEDVRRRTTARLDAAWLVLAGLKDDGKERRRLLLGAAVKSAANAADLRTMDERVGRARIIFGSVFPDDAAELQPANLETAVSHWHTPRSDGDEGASLDSMRWSAMVPLYDDIGCNIDAEAAKREWVTRAR